MTDWQKLTVGALIFALSVNIIILYTKVAMLSTHVEALEEAARPQRERSSRP